MGATTRDPGDSEWFHFGARTFNITRAKRILADQGPAEVQEVATERLTPLLLFIGCDPDHAATLPDEALDVPLIAVNDDGHALLVDGFHRVHEAVRRGRPSLTLHVLSAEQSAAVEVTARH